MKRFQASSRPQKKLLINLLVLRGGGGHYATYNAIRSIIEQKKLPWELSVTFADTIGESSGEKNQVLDISKLLGTSSDKFYDQIQKNGLGWIHLLTIHVHKLLIKLKHNLDVSLLEKNWRQQQPDLIVSVVPFHNKALWESVQKAKLDTPVVTILTDFADCPPAYWIEPQTKNYLVCGTEKAVEQARDLGVDKQHIIKTSGLVIHPRFYQPIEVDRHIERQRLGLDPDCVTGLVLFGANGSKIMLDIAKRLEYFQQKIQLIFLCGRNQEVASFLRRYQSLQKRLVVTFTEDIPYYMHLADFFIGKPGNVSISEALVMKLPVIVERNFLTLPQERYAADWIQEKEVGITIPSFRHIQKAVENLIEPENFARYRTNVAAINNQAVFEIPDILNKILANRACLPILK
ncbi:MAG: glycosyltransferase [Nostocaceae cyanobacterium]|nr:glycosyltransferase [Nostocaceae cyanobacterium]